MTIFTFLVFTYLLALFAGYHIGYRQALKDKTETMERIMNEEPK